MAKKIKYYSIKKVWKLGTPWIMLLGQRANGKSYSSREQVLEDYVDDGVKFVYLRRWKDDIKSSEVESYFNVEQVKRYFPEADGIKAWQNKIWTFHYNEKGLQEKDDWIGWYLALNEDERYKSWEQLSESNVRTLIYEEFITNKTYLDDEPTRLMQLVSTIFRHGEGRVIMVGNTLSQLCPYFDYWNLSGVLKQKQGTIEIYHQRQEDGTSIDLAVENCATVSYENKMFFGQTSKQIVSGEWETENYPTRPKGKWECAYELAVEFNLLRYIVQLLTNDKDEIICFVYESNREVDRVITNKFNANWNYSKTLDMDNRAEKWITMCWYRNKFTYQNNLIATNFNRMVTNYQIM